MYKCKCGKEFSKSQSLNSHKARCPIHRNGIAPVKRNHGGGWNKGLNKENDIRVSKQAESLKNNYRSGKIINGFSGHKHSDEFRKKMSESVIERNNKNESYCNWFSVFNGYEFVKVQGTWEKRVAEKLTQLGFYWTRKRLIYDKVLTYTPDFFLPDFNFYIEVKGWWKRRDIEKMNRVIGEHNVTIKIVDSISIIERLENDIIRLSDLKSFLASGFDSR